MFTVLTEREASNNVWEHVPGSQIWFDSFQSANAYMRQRVHENRRERNAYGECVYKLRFEIRNEDEWDTVLAVGGAA